MYQAFADTYRVTFDDTTLPPSATWLDVTPTNSIFNVDPMLFTDPTWGRTFAGGLDGACSIMSYSDDDGATWTPMGNPCVATLDHQSIASGPWADGIVPVDALSDRAVYYCAQAGAVTCAISYDGGLTFAPGTAIECQGISPGLHGSLHVAASGYLYVPIRACETSDNTECYYDSALSWTYCHGDPAVAVSRDNGVTWSYQLMPDAVGPTKGFDNAVTSATSGRLYTAWNDADGFTYAGTSTDDGASWQSLGRVSNVPVTSFTEVVAGDDDRVSVIYLGSYDGAGDSVGHEPTFAGVWHLYVSTSYDGGATWSTVQATQDPVQRGHICADGTGCAAGRNLLDFIDAQMDGEGRLVVAIADGCVDACASGAVAQSDAAYATIVRQFAGSRLLAAFDPEEVVAAAPAQPVLRAFGGDDRVDLSWSAPFNNGAAISGYTLYRDGAVLATLDPTTVAYADTAVANGNTYSYALTASNSVGTSAMSVAVTVTPEHEEAIDVPELSANEAYEGDFSQGGDADYYRVYIAPGVTQLDIILDGPACLPGVVVCTEDLDLYARKGALPTDDEYDCRPFATGSDETCSYPTPMPGYYYVRVVDFMGTAPSYRLTASIPTSGGDTTTLTNGQTAHASFEGAEEVIYSFELSSATTLDVVLSGPDCATDLVFCLDDIDMYVSHGAIPTDETYDCRPYNTGSEESCHFDAPAAGTWYVRLVDYGGTSPSFDLTASWS